MRGIKRTAEPDYFESIRCRYDSWDELYGATGEQVRTCLGRCSSGNCNGSEIDGLSGESIRKGLIAPALELEFASICAYCEQDCSATSQIEHFRPRSEFPHLWLDWMNLLLACRRCNSGKKGNLWPKKNDAVNQRYSKIDGFLPVTQYIEPNLVAGRRSAEKFFAFYFGEENGGQITASSSICIGEQLAAHRTIEDIDLNDDYGHIDKRLPELRTDELNDLLDEIEERYGDPFDDVTATQKLLADVASQPGQPFSGFILAYVESLAPICD